MYYSLPNGHLCPPVLLYNSSPMEQVEHGATQVVLGSGSQHMDGAAPIDQGHPTEVGVGSGVCCCPLHVPP